MSEELTKALQNFVHRADPTWNQRPLRNQRADLNLYLTQRLNKEQDDLAPRPRTVRDTIPQSKLAKYGNYEYNTARELSYAPVYDHYENLYSRPDNEPATEPWMMDSVDKLFKAYVGIIGIGKDQKPVKKSNKKNQQAFDPQFNKRSKGS